VKHCYAGVKMSSDKINRVKIAVLADIHSNLRAFEATIDHIMRWKADRVVIAGDIVNRGPMPSDCWRLAVDQQQNYGWHIIKGNHEDYVVEHIDKKRDLKGAEKEIYRLSEWTFEQMGMCARALKKIPLHVSFNDELRGEQRFTHASMLGIRDGMWAKSSDERLTAQMGLPIPSLFCAAHTHQPFVRYVGSSCVVNPGAVGLPFDRDTRASYAQIVWQKDTWLAEIVRIPYDRDRARADFVDSGYLENASALAKLVLNEFEQARSHLFEWHDRYHSDVLNHKITVSQAVDHYLAHKD
jgi:predicted phosphodiesterase